MIYGRQLCPQSLASERAPGSFPEKDAPLGGLEFDKQKLQLPTYLQLGQLRAGSVQPMTVPHYPAEPAELSCSNNVRGAPLSNLGLRFLSSSPTLFTRKVTSVWPDHLNVAVTEKDELDTLCAHELFPGQEEWLWFRQCSLHGGRGSGSAHPQRSEKVQEGAVR